MASLAISGQQAAISARVNLINCWVAIDNSGSMSGNKWNLAVSGVEHLIRQLTSSDHVGILTFGDEVKVVHAGPKGDGEQAIRELRKCRANGGGTNLYDAIIKAGMLSLTLHIELRNAAAARGVSSILTYMVLLTDGEDTGSKASTDDVKQLLSRANQFGGFKIVLTGIGLSSGPARIMREFGSIGDRDIEFRELKDNRDIQNLFEHVALEITQTFRTLVINENGQTAYVEQNRRINLGNGQMSNETRGVVMSQRPSESRAMMITDGTQSPTPLTSRAPAPAPAPAPPSKPIPQKTEDFWDRDYDLSAVETAALTGYVLLQQLIFIFLVPDPFSCCIRLCCMAPCCSNCWQPAAIDHCCCLTPSQCFAPCVVGQCIAGTCGFLGTPFRLTCCLCCYCKMCVHFCNDSRYT
jgi:uncharacterized protein YegL